MAYRKRGAIPLAPASAGPPSSAPASSSERDQIIARLRCIRGSTFTSARGVKGRIEWDGLRRLDDGRFVPFEGTDRMETPGHKPTGLECCSLEALREVVRDNEAHIEHIDDRERDKRVTLQEHLDAHPEDREKVKRIKAAFPGLLPKTKPAEVAKPRPGEKRREPIIEELDPPEGFPEPARTPEDEEIPF